MRNKFNQELANLNGMLANMCVLIEQAITSTVDALSTNNCVKAQAVIDNDEAINNMEKSIETLCLRIILTEQPVANDLRTVSSALKVITDLERIGDQASDIARLVIKNNNNKLALDYGHISQMAQATIAMVNQAVIAFTAGNIELARRVYFDDDIVDTLFDKCRKDVVKLIVSNASNSDEALDMLMTAKYFERIGDHATNIAEWVSYAITGSRTIE